MPSQSGAHSEAIGADAARVLVSRDEIARRVARLAGELVEAYPDREVTLVAVLTGALVFVADLIRRLPIRLRVEVARVSSYRGPATRAQDLRFALPLEADLAGREVLIVDDILDSGRTLSALVALVGAMRPASVRTCVLLRKSRPDVPERISPDFVGFDIPDEFAVGYGLDHDNLYRNLPDLCVLRGGGDGAAGTEVAP